MKKVYLFQPQYTVQTATGYNCWIPYSVGCIWSYAAAHDEINQNFELCDLIFQREPITELLHRLDNPAVCGFSCYMWNEQWCLQAAKAIKHTWPQCVIVFGGPQAHENYIDRFDFVDSVILGEGEESFLHLLQNMHTNTQQKIYDRQRIQNLSIPSPYLTGVFDKIIANNPDIQWSMVWETNRGCPFACTFCDWGSATNSKVKQFDMHRLEQEIEWIIANPIYAMYLADANFGVFKERDLIIARMLKGAQQRGTLESVNVQFAKNSNEHVYEIGKVFGDLVYGITMDLQSTNLDTLDAIKRRNLDSNNTKELLSLAEKYQIKTYTSLILGLPLETVDSWRQGLANIVDMGHHNNVVIWFAQMFPNSEMSQPDYKLRYGIQTVTAQDYMSQSDTEEQEKITEKIELINQTSTMTTEQMVDCYMYSWMYLQFHFTGYSQIHARYCRHLHNISYQQFYDGFYSAMLSNAVVANQYQEVKQKVSHYLKHGTPDRKATKRQTSLGHGLMSTSYPVMYENRDAIYNLVYQYTTDLIGHCPDDVDFLQRAFLLDVNTMYPVTLPLSFDPTTWQKSSCHVTVHPSVGSDEITHLFKEQNQSILTKRMYDMHKNGKLKNKITVDSLHQPQKTVIPIHVVSPQ